MNKLLQELIAQRDALEIEAEAIGNELTSVGVNGEPPIGLKTPLVDAEGFPRGDIDVYNARQKRHRLSVINTDHKLLMQRIERELHLIHSSLPSSAASTTPAEAPQSSLLQDYKMLKPIAKIDMILKGSPAEAAGLLNDDLLLRFGSVDCNISNPLNAIPAIVKNYINGKVELLVRREGREIALQLEPKTWEGRGLLGCHLSPL